MKRKLLGNIFNRNKDRPDAKWEDVTPNLRYFFKLFGRKFWRLISLNLMMLPIVLPLLLALLFFIYRGLVPSNENALFPALYGANLINPSPESGFLLDLFGGQISTPAYNATGTYIGIGISLGLLALTFGWQNIGATYVLRGLVRGDAVFIWSDYFYAIKRNWKQGFFLGLIDFLILSLLGFDIYYFYFQNGGFAMNLMFYASCALMIIYFFMRFYIYLLQITFKISIRKILKNALIFTPLGIKRNIMGLLGIVLLTAINFFLIILVNLTGGLIGVGLILPLLHYPAFTGFITTYSAYPIIDRYMIQPYNQTKKPEAE